MQRREDVGATKNWKAPFFRTWLRWEVDRTFLDSSHGPMGRCLGFALFCLISKLLVEIEAKSMCRHGEVVAEPTDGNRICGIPPPFYVSSSHSYLSKQLFELLVMSA